jgi:hypothetical protein
MNTTEAARRWAGVWKQGWEALDPEPILACYAPHAVLSTEPFRQPYRGIDGVREYVTQALGEEEDPRVWLSEPIAHGDRAAIAWWASLRENGAETTFAGTSVLRFDADGLVIEQWDTWNQLPERRDPSPDFGPFRG